MIWKRILWILIGFACSISTVVFLYHWSFRSNHQGNGFVRLIFPHGAVFKKQLNIGVNSYYFAGASDNHLFLGNYTYPPQILALDTQLHEQSTIRLSLSNLPDSIFGGVKVVVKPPHIFAMEGQTPTIAAFLFDSPSKWPGTENLRHFDYCMPLSPTSYIIRRFDPVSQCYALEKWAIQGAIYQPVSRQLLDSGYASFFGGDGCLSMDPSTSLLVYSYYYTNRFLILDSNLKLKGLGKTIDTVCKPHLIVMNVRSDRSVRLAAPPLVVSKNASAYGSILYIQADRMAGNENSDLFSNCSVFDMFDYQTGQYLHSFYIPDFKGKKANGFMVEDSMLFVLQDNYIFSYDIRLLLQPKRR